MTKRMLDKNREPDISEIEAFIGKSSNKRFQKIEKILNENYTITRELRFPFGNTYVWAYKYNHKKKHLLYLFFANDGLICTFQINDQGADIVEEHLDSFLPETKEFWKSRYPCGKRGGCG